MGTRVRGEDYQVIGGDEILSFVYDIDTFRKSRLFKQVNKRDLATATKQDSHAPNGVVGLHPNPVGNGLVLLLLNREGSLGAEGFLGRLW